MKIFIRQGLFYWSGTG